MHLMLEDEVCWDPNKSNEEIYLSADFRFAQNFNSNYAEPKTVFSNRPFLDGAHYWELLLDARNDALVSIGVSLDQNTD